MKTQIETVLYHLKTHKGITNYDAINEYGILRLSAIIFKLRKSGYEIENVYHKAKDGYRGNLTQYVEYRLVKGEKK